MSVWYREASDVIGVIIGNVFTASNNFEACFDDTREFEQLLKENGYIYIGEFK